MKKQIIFALAFTVLSASQVFAASDIDTKLWGLQYKPDEVLVYKGTDATSFVPKSGQLEGNKFIVVTRKKCDISNGFGDMGVVGSIAATTYPGSILLANSRLVDNAPTPLIASRKPVTVTVDLPGMSAAESTFTVKDASYSEYQSGLNSVLGTWTSKYAANNKIVARLQYSFDIIRDESQMEASLGMEMKEVNKALKIDFNAIRNEKKTVAVAVFKQIYYSATVKLLAAPSQYFSDTTTFADLTNHGVNKENPPVLVNHVDYGRTLYVKMETSEVGNDVSAAFSAAMDSTKGELATKYKNILSKTTFTVYALGGGAGTHVEVLKKNNLDGVMDVITKNIEYSPRNPGYPVSYSTVFLKDNSPAVVKATASYIETNRQEYTKGKVTLKHKGWYVARFNVNWQTVSYDAKGNQILTNQSWGDNGKNRTAPYETTIELPANATNIEIKAEGKTGLAWEPWRTSFHETRLPLIEQRTVSVWGSTLKQRSSMY